MLNILRAGRIEISALFLYSLKIAILDSSGNIVVQYKYDAWGYHTVSGSNTTLGNLNPFRYRSYYFDTETKLYYLQSRYYDPETGRFLNMDSLDYADPETINGLNLFAYCGNNPVMNVDPEGTAWWHWLLGGLAVVALTIVTAGVAGAAAFAIGSALGVGSALVGVTAGGAMIGGLVAGGVELLSQGITSNWQQLDFGSLAIETFTGAVYGGIAGMMGSTTSAALRLGLRGGLIALSGINSLLHGINDNKSFTNIMGDVGLSILTSALIQTAFIGLDARAGKLSSSVLESYALDGGLFGTMDFLKIGLITLGKNLWGNKNTWINFAF
ncbi:MAG: RHS repeat-associated core domain-containing protein [Clostridia bacterium]|nr:RHS repeat-associated core domain-containing protein [Clostridia bacterium]